ncbi:MAG TPA: RNA polymerase sigma factor SigJ [Solirubrobacteraceae bacterium]|nr:RNA polymerase sigma factor SigJ [Solirubrobacteraceae bacterium]
MSAMTAIAEEFEGQRPRLRALAYRMLGSVAEAEDAVQEAWLRLGRADERGVDDLGAWLTTVLGRICIDMLRARRARRETLAGEWLPEPVVSADGDHDPEQQALLADSVGMALLVVLESLSPAERLAFVLHDMFAVPFEEIAPIVDRSPEATRQLASRARRRVRGAAPAPDPDMATQRRVVDAFLAAARAGDFEALLEILDPGVVLRVDPGSREVPLPRVLSGGRVVAERVAASGPGFARFCRPALVNGSWGWIVVPAGGELGGVGGATVTDGRITEIDLVLDPAKLAGIAIG